MDKIKYLRAPVEGEVVEKKSRFIARIVPVKTEEEALSFIEAVKKKHYDARHNCSAYIVGQAGENYKCSDDGEPARTAGMPMLSLLQKEGLTDVCATVTRYFGGVLLGTGGLVRAYQEAIKDALLKADIYELSPYREFSVVVDYGVYGKLENLATNNGYLIEDASFTNEVSLRLFVPADKEDGIITTLSNLSNGAARVTMGDLINK